MLDASKVVMEMKRHSAVARSVLQANFRVLGINWNAEIVHLASHKLTMNLLGVSLASRADLQMQRECSYAGSVLQDIRRS